MSDATYVSRHIKRHGAHSAYYATNFPKMQDVLLNPANSLTKCKNAIENFSDFCTVLPIKSLSAVKRAVTAVLPP